MFEDAEAMERAELFREREVFAMLDNDRGAGSEEVCVAEKIEDTGVFDCGCVGRIEEDEVDERGTRFLF